MAQLFHHLSFQTFQSDNDDEDSLPQLGIDDTKEYAFVDLYSAKKSLDFLTKDSLRIVRTVALVALTKQGLHEQATVGSEVAIQRGRLERWSIKFENLVAIMDGLYDEQSVEELRTMHISATIWLELSVSADQPESANSLVTAVNQAEAQHQRHCTQHHDHLSANFAFEEGIVPPMYFTTTKRHHINARPKNMALLVMRRSKGIGSDGRDNLARLVEDRPGLDGRRVLGVELDTMARQIDLSYLPGQGQEDGTWQVMANG